MSGNATLFAESETTTTFFDESPKGITDVGSLVPPVQVLTAATVGIVPVLRSYGIFIHTIEDRAYFVPQSAPINRVATPAVVTAFDLSEDEGWGVKVTSTPRWDLPEGEAHDDETRMRGVVPLGRENKKVIRIPVQIPTKDLPRWRPFITGRARDYRSE